jgi:hypothetical protein
MICAYPNYSVVRHFAVPSECRNYNCLYSTADGLCAYHLTQGDFRRSSELPWARFSQPFRLENHLFDQRNENQNILSLLAEGHIQFSQGQRPWTNAKGISNHAVSILRTERGANK